MGHEQKGTRPALVLTSKEFNRLGDVLVAPITQGGDFSRYAGFAVSLTGSGCKTQGVALVNKIRMLDLAARKARKIERVPQVVLDDALGRLTALLESWLQVMTTRCIARSPIRDESFIEDGSLQAILTIWTDSCFEAFGGEGVLIKNLSESRDRFL
jgi:mRNA interferase ChpB